MKNYLIFIGVVKKSPDCGISMKNFFFIKKFQEYYDKVWVVNVNCASWQKYYLPFRLLNILVLALLHPKAKIVISSNTWESNIIIKALNFFGMSKRSYYWVPGGVFHKIVKERFKLSTFKQINKLYVQSPSIVKGLEKLGFTNALFVPNSKMIDYYPTKILRNDNKIRFVFLSRIHPDKGCGMIINCAKRLNELGYSSRFTVDFFGRLFDEYKEDFIKQCDKLSNVIYQGYINLTENAGYDKLSSYDMMLFPTYWWGEGFPGVIIDAYIAGLPIIASDWNCNCDVVDQETGIIIHAKNEDELFQEMKNTIDGKYDLALLSQNCQRRAKQYDNEYVLSESNLKQIGML
jgi:glycosyltransferase involved in cell wall biosynthesis